MNRLLEHGLPLAISLALVSGCKPPAVTFPDTPLSAGARQIVYDSDGDGRGDCIFLLNAAGRIDRVARDGGDPNSVRVVELDKIPLADCRHVVILLDGVRHDLVREFRDAGHLRMFHPPSLVIAPYPTLTDPALEDALGLPPARAMEAEYYDPNQNEIEGGSGEYLEADELPYNRVLDYRAETMMDAYSYLWPQSVFRKEINDAKRLIDARAEPETLVYLVSTAGLGTKLGRAGHLHALADVERLVGQLLCETGGKCKFTIFSDHGHTYTPGERIDMEGHLKQRGWNLAGRIDGDRDVAYVRFGLVTYLSLSGKHPAELAADAVACAGAELASYVDGNSVVVLDASGGRAVIGRKGERYSYKPSAGDPLKLREVLAKLKPDAEGYYDADEMLTATAASEYPAAPERLWRAHFGLVETPPDVIVSLADGFYSGSKELDAWADVQSTHGSLRASNSAAFIMSTIGPLPGVLRSAEIPANMAKLTGRKWPRHVAAE